MPIENAALVWPENVSPFIAVARITVAQQTALSPEHAHASDDNLAFSLWHGVAAHRPLGSLMRVRQGGVCRLGQLQGSAQRLPHA